MARPEPVYSFCLLLVVLVLQGCSELTVASMSEVEFLPGFEGPLPFELETGYIGVGESEDVQLFYYFVKSEGNPTKDPVLLWLTGGPGCSALSGLLYKIGPLKFEVVEYNGSLPTLQLNPYSWTKAASMIFVDFPVGTGFSYARTQLASETGDFLQIKQLNEFFRKWLIDHQELASNPVYLGGDSFSGRPLPALAQQILIGKLRKHFENLQKTALHLRVVIAMIVWVQEMKRVTNRLLISRGYILGNAATNAISDENSATPYAHGMGLISDELFQSLEKSCKGEYTLIDPTNSVCLNLMQDYYKCTSRINGPHILEPFCVFASPKPIEISFHQRRILNQKFIQNFADPDPPLPTFGCRTYGYLLAKYWIDDTTVQKALNIREGTVKNWQRCKKSLPYKHEIFNAINYHLYLGNKGYRSLIYSGDHDMLMPFLATEAWIKSLNFSIVDHWRPWYLQFQT